MLLPFARRFYLRLCNDTGNHGLGSSLSKTRNTHARNWSSCGVFTQHTSEIRGFERTSVRKSASASCVNWALNWLVYWCTNKGRCSLLVGSATGRRSPCWKVHEFSCLSCEIECPTLVTCWRVGQSIIPYSQVSPNTKESIIQYLTDRPGQTMVTLLASITCNTSTQILIQAKKLVRGQNTRIKT